VTKRAAQQSTTAGARLGLAMRVVVGGVLVFSALTKMPIHSEFVSVVNSYNILPEPLATAYAVALPWVELIVGGYLVFGIFIKISASLAVLMGISYAVANVSSLLHGEKVCGSCFGLLLAMPVAYSVMIDIFIIVVGVYLLLRSTQAFTLAWWIRGNRRER